MRLFLMLIALIVSPPLSAEGTCALRSQIGQMFLVGMPYEVFAKSQNLTELKNTQQKLKNLNIGGIVVFGHNLTSAPGKPLRCADKKQVQNFIDSLQAERQPKMFVAIDQEGGQIQRLRECHGFKKIPSHEEIARLKDPAAAYKIAYQAGIELRALGFNWNFAPVLDVNGKTKNPAIGGLGRAFSADAQKVSRYGEKLFQGTQAAGLIASAKHFPGHGEATDDTHSAPSEIHKSWEALTRKELVPFVNAFNKGIDSVMIGHITLSQECKLGDEPASLNEKIIQNVLRDQMNYNGLVVTDDLSMGAITSKYELGDAIKKSILAGNDMMIVKEGDYPAAIEKLCEVLNTDSTESLKLRLRIEQANQRIALLKKKKAI